MIDFESAVDRAADAFLFAVRPTADARAEAAAARELWTAVSAHAAREDETHAPEDINATMDAVAARARDKFMAARRDEIPPGWRGVRLSEFFRLLDDFERRLNYKLYSRTPLGRMVEASGQRGQCR